MKTDEAWMLTPTVALRPEPFGALAYNYSNRKLTFLKRPELVEVLKKLGDHADVGSTLAAVGVPEAHHRGYLAALSDLAAAGMIRPQAEENPS